MTLLQAVGYGSIFYILLIIILIIGLPLLTGLFMKIYWKLIGKRENIIDRKPYYKEPLPFIICLSFSAVTLLGIFYLLLITFAKGF
jgi:hypothetical protein